MMLKKPKFWDNKIGLISTVLFPLTLIFLFVIYLKKIFTKVETFKIPVICVGNIYIGGTGKTPTSIFLAKEIIKSGKKPVILRKYYDKHKDEHALIESNFINLVLNENRIKGMNEVEKSNFDVAILDDGFQDYKIKKNLSIICFNSNQLVGNGLVLPAGPLRENLNSLKNANIILINGNKKELFEKKILNINEKLEIFYSSYEPVNIDQFKHKKLLAFAGIGNPQNFFELLERNNLHIGKKIIFPDHYSFSRREIQNILDEAEIDNYEVITTEKDYLRIQNFNLNKIKYLKTSLKIENYEKLLNIIKRLI